MRSKKIVLLSFLTTISLCLTLLLGGVLHMARLEKTYTEGFLRFADTALSGVEKSDYLLLGQTIAAFFQGKTDSAQATVYRFGVLSDAFSEKELQHLHDLKTLFARLDICFYVLAALTAALLSLHIKAKRFSLLGMGLTLLLPLGIALWAVIDFYSLFYGLHLLLFPNNDLWLLDPNTDLLIQLMPQSLFVNLALKLSLYLLPVLLLPLINYRRKKNDVR